MYFDKPYSFKRSSVISTIPLLILLIVFVLAPPVVQGNSKAIYIGQLYALSLDVILSKVNLSISVNTELFVRLTKYLINDG
jgi:hypothetical protein